jgi:hypothetical protein
MKYGSFFVVLYFILLPYGKNVIFFSKTPAGFFALLSAVMRNMYTPEATGCPFAARPFQTTSLAPYFETALISLYHTLLPRMSYIANLTFSTPSYGRLYRMRTIELNGLG